MDADGIPGDLITPKLAAGLLLVGLPAVYGYIRRGRLRAWRRAHARLLVSEAEVRALLEPVAPAAGLPGTRREDAARAAHTAGVLRRAGIG